MKFKTKRKRIEALDKLKSNRKLLYKYNVILYILSVIIAISGWCYRFCVYSISWYSKAFTVGRVRSETCVRRVKQKIKPKKNVVLLLLQWEGATTTEKKMFFLKKKRWHARLQYRKWRSEPCTRDVQRRPQQLTVALATLATYIMYNNLLLFIAVVVTSVWLGEARAGRCRAYSTITTYIVYLYTYKISHKL